MEYYLIALAVTLKTGLSIAIDSIHKACEENKAEMKVAMVCYDLETYRVMNELLEN